jgi:hypothetical protein
VSIRTAPALPADHGKPTASHYDLAAAMRNTDEWVLVSGYTNRRTALNIASKIRNGVLPAYRRHIYEARAITTADGAHETWGRYVGERGPR